VKTLEEITYEAGRAALAEQESIVGGIRQRTGTLLAAHALVASFLGGASVRGDAIGGGEIAALGSLFVALVLAAVLLAPWPMRFAVDARELYDELYLEAMADTEVGAMGWLATAGASYQALHDRNASKVRLMGNLSAVLAVLLVLETTCWLLALPLQS
jgi:hypothetical protein